MSKKQRISLTELKERGRQKKLSEVKMPEIEDIYQKCTDSVLAKKLMTGLVFDDIFRLHECVWDPKYPENPDRYNCILERFDEYNLPNRCQKVKSREASRDELLSLHDEEAINLMDNLPGTHFLQMERFATNYDSVYFNQSSLLASRVAAGSTIKLVEAVVKKEVQNGMAIVRPPGHHAMENTYCGYCIFNNVALAAKNALDNLGVKRVLIVDWDVHHGQATQQMFYDDPRVLYFSIHRFEHGTFWPNLRDSDFDCIGDKAGKFYNINIPLNETECGDADYLTIFHSVLLPVAYEFAPELVLISAGYDAAVGCFEFAPELVIVSAGFDSCLGDWKGYMKVSPGCYHHLTTSLMGLANGRVVAVLEGGYYPPSLAEGAAQTLRALLGDPAPVLEKLLTPKDSVISVIQKSLILLRIKWACFAYFNDDEAERDTENNLPQSTYRGEVLRPPFNTRGAYPVHNAAEKGYFKWILQRHKSNNAAHPISVVGLTYDAAMRLHVSPKANEFEMPERLSRCYQIFSELAISNRMKEICCQPASDVQLKTVHLEEYINAIKNIGTHSILDLMESKGWTTVFTNDSTNQCARLAAGSLLNLVQTMLKGEITSGVALIRPPGHHAEKDAASGFCIFNNVAIAAKYALSAGLKRVLIFDWDIHHGNGIQRAFYDDPRVLYISTHRYDNAKYFPYSTDADYTKIGEGGGKYYNVNIPWNNKIMGDPEYMAAITRIVMPISYEFNPELVIIAAGFDACKGDPLGGYTVTPEAFGHFVQLLKPLAGGRIILALEGGYNINSVGYAFGMCCKSLLNDPLPPLNITNNVNSEALATINQTISVHSNKWQLLQKKCLLI